MTLLLALAALLGGVWLWRTGRLPRLGFMDVAAIVLALVALRMLVLGRVIVGVVLLALAVGWALMRARNPAADISAAEARALLELPDGADADAIRSAHRRIIARVHPDVGGSQELARRVNAARDRLLDEWNRNNLRAS